MDGAGSGPKQALILPAYIIVATARLQAANHRRFLRERVRINSAHNLFFSLQNLQLEIALYI